MGIAAEAKRTGAKVPPILQPDKKEHSPPSTKNRSHANRTRFLIFLQMPIENAQELAKEEGDESEANLRAAIVTSEGAIPAVAGKRRDT